MPPSGRKHLPALIEVGFRTEPPHHVGNLHGELALIADLEQPDLAITPSRAVRVMGMTDLLHLKIEY
jgi:hypothetical protein